MALSCQAQQLYVMYPILICCTLHSLTLSTILIISVWVMMTTHIICVLVVVIIILLVIIIIIIECGWRLRLRRLWHRLRVSWMELRADEDIGPATNVWIEKIPDRSDPNKPADKLVGPHNEGWSPSNNYKGRETGGERDNRKTDNHDIEIDDKGWLQLVEGESWTTWRKMMTLDVYEPAMTENQRSRRSFASSLRCFPISVTAFICTLYLTSSHQQLGLLRSYSFKLWIQCATAMRITRFIRFLRRLCERIGLRKRWCRG